MNASGAAGSSPGSVGAARGGVPGPAASALLILALTLIPRLAVLPQFRADSLNPDGAHFLNVARCFERGQGFSNPSAWPAWMKPARLPMPETFKEPGYPWLIARAARAGADPFRAGQALSLIAGLLLPLVIWGLARRTFADPLAALMAALIAAGSPLLVDKSASVLVESLFALFIALTFLSAAGRAGSLARAALTGALFGASYLLRAQSALALPALVLLVGRGRPIGRRLVSLLVAGLVALAVMSPLIARNLRLFGVPFYSDVTAYGLWPYTDQFAFSHGLDRPGSPIAFALAHPAAIAAHMAGSAWVFAKWALPRELYGDPLWAVALVAGVVALWRSRRDWGFAAVYAAVTVGFILAVHWDTYYFTSSMTAWCLLAGAGAAWAARALDARFAAGGRARALAAPAVVALGVIGPLIVALTRPPHVGSYRPPELAAARHEAPFLRARLGPDESVMVNTTSYWAWVLDRPAVHFVVTDSARFAETVHRLKVRWAVLPTAEIPEFAARYPGGRLPALLSVDHVDPERGVTVYQVSDPDRHPPPTGVTGRP